MVNALGEDRILEAVKIVRTAHKNDYGGLDELERIGLVAAHFEFKKDLDKHGNKVPDYTYRVPDGVALAFRSRPAIRDRHTCYAG